jgi:hypothetical protein
MRSSKNLIAHEININIMKSLKLVKVNHVARMRGMRSADKYLAGKTEGKSTIGRPRRGQKDSVKLNVNKIV